MLSLIVRVRPFELSRITQPASHVIIRSHISFEFVFCMANMSDDGDWELLYFARLQELRRSRGSRKGYITKSENRIKELMSCDENVELVKNDLVEFNAYVAKFREAHLAYHEQLSDELHISESMEYYNSVMLSASDFERELSSWIVERFPKTLLATLVRAMDQGLRNAPKRVRPVLAHLVSARLQLQRQELLRRKLFSKPKPQVQLNLRLCKEKD